MNETGFYQLLEIYERIICFKPTVVPLFPRAGSFSLKGVKAAHFARGYEHLLKKEDTIVNHKRCN